MSFDFVDGASIGDYQVLTRLSVGGMSEVFLAVASRPARQLVTLKRILPELRELDEFVQMFLDEARITASLSHKNIARVFELGHEGGELFIAMEFVQGQSLASIVRAFKRNNRPVPLGFAGRVMRDVSEALQHAHAYVAPTGEPSPIVHRDVSPSNV